LGRSRADGAHDPQRLLARASAESALAPPSGVRAPGCNARSGAGATGFAGQGRGAAAVRV
jgi:hypothetical protein